MTAVTRRKFPAVALAIAASAAVYGALPAQAGGLADVPSGQDIWPYEYLWEDHTGAEGGRETWLVLRFLTPGIAQSGGTVDFDKAAPDLDYLCREIGLPVVQMSGGGVDLVLVNLMDKPVPRGLRDSSATQFMSSYRLEEGACKWE